MLCIVSPGHAIILQPSVLIPEPTQSAPPPRGAGFVQVRVRVCEPKPQVTEQLLQDDHWVQLPSTGSRTKVYAVLIIIFSHTYLLIQSPLNYNQNQ